MAEQNDKKHCGDVALNLLVQELLEHMLLKTGGKMSGSLTVSGLILTKNVDYGDTLPAAGTPGRVFFVRAK